MTDHDRPDEIFANPRLAEIYDIVDPDRSDLDHYLAMVSEFGARSVLDVGCGTGTFGCLLAAQDIEVTGVDPADASLDVARQKPGADRVRWLHGDATMLPPLDVDLATMTANVAQVFVTDAAWAATLVGIHRAVGESGRLAFETRTPARRAWEEWTPEASRRTIEIPSIGAVEKWVELVDVSLPLVSFRHTYQFAADGAVITSDSTLRFRERDEIEASLTATGWRTTEVREAPDRPGKEYVFVATKVSAV